MLGLFYLNNLLLFLTPLDDPEEDNILDDEEEYVIKDTDKDEYKGF